MHRCPLPVTYKQCNFLSVLLKIFKTQIIMNLKKTLVKNKVIRTTVGDVSFCGQSNV